MGKHFFPFTKAHVGNLWIMDKELLNINDMKQCSPGNDFQVKVDKAPAECVNCGV
jgi:hypothetical protein